MEIGKEKMTSTKRVCVGCKNIFAKSDSKKRIYGVFEWEKKIIVMCKKCLLQDQKDNPEQWKYGKFLWDSLSDIEKMFYITSRSHEEAKENQLEFGKIGIQKWEEIEMLHQWLLMCTINKFGPPNKGDVDSDEKPDHDIHTFIHCKKCIETKSSPILEAGWTRTGMIVKCFTHNLELSYIPLPSFMTRKECMNEEHPQK